MKKVIPCVLICIFLICVFFLGKSLGSAENTTAGIEVAIPEESAEQSLRISANIDKNEGFNVISLEQGNYHEISYLNLINVSIEIDGTRCTSGRIYFCGRAHCQCSEGCC